MPRHQRFGRRQAEVVAFRLQPLAHLDDVAVALRGQQPDLGTLPFQQRIGGDGGAMDHALGLPQQLIQRQVQGGGEVAQPLDHAEALVGRGAGGFGQGLGPVGGDATTSVKVPPTSMPIR